MRSVPHGDAHDAPPRVLFPWQDAWFEPLSDTLLGLMFL